MRLGEITDHTRVTLSKEHWRMLEALGDIPHAPEALALDLYGDQEPETMHHVRDILKCLVRKRWVIAAPPGTRQGYVLTRIGWAVANAMELEEDET